MLQAIQKYSGPTYTQADDQIIINKYYFRNIELINISKKLSLAWLRQVYPFADWKIYCATLGEPLLSFYFAFLVKKEFAAQPISAWQVLYNTAQPAMYSFVARLEHDTEKYTYWGGRRIAGTMFDYFKQCWITGLHTNLIINNNLFLFTFSSNEEAFVTGPRNASHTNFVYPSTSKLVERHWSLFAKKYSAALAVLATYESC